MTKMKTILATAYAVNPYKGSEDGMGWNALYQIARFQKVIAITRENNQTNIEKFMKENPDPVFERMQFLYFDLPKWARFWKRKNKGALFYFWMWQRAIPGFVKNQNIQFDIAHNLNFHNDWTPSFLHRLKVPFVWGPIGHHPRIPSQYLQPYHRFNQWKDSVIWIIKKAFWQFSPGLRATINKADHILCMNNSVPKVIDLSNKKYSIIPSVATEDYGYEKSNKGNKFQLISAGRLVPLKGFDLSINAFADFLSTDLERKNNSELLIIGSGPEKTYLQQLSRDRKIETNVRFIDWMERKSLIELYKTSSIFIFPSHEGAGMVVAEALSFGLPVICLKNAGPGEFINDDCGFAILQQDYKNTIIDLSKAITVLYKSPQLLEKMSQSARDRFKKHFDWNRRGEQLKKIYQTL